MQPEQAHKHDSGSGVGLRLGGARADFVAGLGRKVADLRSSLVRVKHAPGDVALRDELRRKLHALGAAARLMKCDAMDRAIAEGLGVLDRTARDGAVDEADVDRLDQIVDDLPALAWGEGHARSSVVEAAEKAAVPRFAVLVVGPAVIAEALLAPESGPRVPSPFACQTTPDAQAAFDLVRTTEPDLVIVDADVDDALELTFALTDDPLTEGVPLVVLGSFLEDAEHSKYVALGVARTLKKPTSRETLRLVCEETLAPRPSSAPRVPAFGELTLVELGDRLALEVKRAILDTPGKDSDRRIPLGEGSEVLGAVWGAIARVREVVTSRTDGTVRFDSVAPVVASAPLNDTDVARSDRARTQTRGIAAEVRLEGRRVVVCDDDPAVVWFMADLLKTAGCQVFEAFDGEDALALAHKHAPDLVVSDILMPRLDGFSLSRALGRDVALRDVPVILLSWKEDLLQRVRELGAGAAGYIRKESDTRAIVARIREALRPRARVEARLREEGEVRGRLDGISVHTLLEAVSTIRPESRVSIRDASFLYEIELRNGEPRRATRTAGDGTFLKGARVFGAMLGISAGRFIVAPSTAPMEGDLVGDLAFQLKVPIERARAATKLLVGPALVRVARVVLDDAALADYLYATPERARRIAERLAAGTAPQAVLLDSEPTLFEDIVFDLAARGIIVRVEDDKGEDLLVTEREAMPASGIVSSASTAKSVACVETNAPLCESPLPGAASLGDVVMQEISHRSPSPMETETSDRVERPRHPRVVVDEGTPPVAQILALSETTQVDDTVYGAPEPSIIIEEGVEFEEEGATRTPFTSVTTGDMPAEIPMRRKWPTVAFVAASALVAWAVVHFTLTPAAVPKRVETAPPAATEMPDQVTYSPAPTELPDGHGLIDVSAPADAVVVVDGAERGKGSAKVPMTAGHHDVRVRTSGDERGCTVDVHTSRVAHVRF